MVVENKLHELFFLAAKIDDCRSQMLCCCCCCNVVVMSDDATDMLLVVVIMDGEKLSSLNFGSGLY